MAIPAMYYVGLGFNWLFVLLTIVGYFYILNKTGKKWAFILIFATTWIVMGISYIFLVSGATSDEWYITLIRVIGYILFLSTILTAIVELTKVSKPA